MREEKKMSIRPGVVARKIGSELILVPIKTRAGDVDYVYTTNAVGVRIWELIKSGKSFTEIKHQIIREYRSDQADIEADIMHFLTQLEQIGAIRVG